MRRIYLIRMLRVIVSGSVAACLILLLSLWGIGREVWVAKVFTNGPQDFVGHLRYLLYAFSDTRISVQVLTLLTAASCIWLAREVARLIATPFTFAHV